MLNENMDTNKLLKISISLNVFTLFLIFVLGIFIYNNNIQINDLWANYDLYYSDYEFEDNGALIDPVTYPYTDSPDDSPYMATEFVEYTGVILKEKIPEDYELGDYWYNFYFDEPQVIETAAGRMKQSYVQIQASEIESLDPYVGMNVTVFGRLSYGYAESRIILADEIIVNE